MQPKNLLASLDARASKSNGSASGASEKDKDLPVPIVPKKDTYYDFLLKEMMWLSEDFTQERSRHRTAARKMANAVKMYHDNKELRQRRSQEQQLCRTKAIARKMSRDVKNFWTKVRRSDERRLYCTGMGALLSASYEALYLTCPSLFVNYLDRARHHVQTEGVRRRSPQEGHGQAPRLSSEADGEVRGETRQGPRGG